MPPRALLTFDLDGVLCRPPFGINPGSGKNKRRDAPGRRGILWRTETWRYRGRKPMPGAMEAFREFAATFDCVVLTARAEVARPLTEQWFRRYLGEVPRILMRPHWGETSAAFKVRMVSDLQPLAHFEDDPFTAQWVAEIIPTVFLVDWPRNRWLAGSNIHRITALAEAVPLLAGVP